MLLAVTPAVVGVGTDVISWTVPGGQVWKPRAFRATAARDAGGAPARGYVLTITDGTNIVAMVGADDNGTEPGTIDITWAATPAATVAVGALGVSIAPLGPFTLTAGYLVQLSIENAVGTDQWTDAVAWYDYIYTASPGIG